MSGNETSTRSKRDQILQDAIVILYGDIHDFVEAIQSGEPPDPRTLEMLAGKFKAWLAGEDARKLFPKPSRGGPLPNRSKLSEQRRLALAVALRMQGGRTEADAIRDVAEERDKPEGTVKAAFNKRRPEAKKQAAKMKVASRIPQVR